MGLKIVVTILVLAYADMLLGRMAAHIPTMSKATGWMWLACVLVFTVAAIGAVWI